MTRAPLPPDIRGVLLDVDGTLLDGDRAIPGAPEAVERLRAAGCAVRFTTNTTRRSRAAVASALRAAGFAAQAHDVVAPSILANHVVSHSGRRRALLLVPPETHADFPRVEIVPRDAEWVVVGDLGAGFDWEILNRAFLELRAGARLVALQKNPWWHAGDAGPRLDAGAFVAALEYAADVRALVVGKPARMFFDLALDLLGLQAQQVLVAGDDPANDAGGGAAAGCRTVLVRTGKGASAPEAQADLVLDSIADLG